MLIGLLRKYEKPMVKDEVAAMVAKEHGQDVIFFSPSGVDFNNKLIYGKSFRRGEWKNEVSYFPDVVYNDIALKKDEEIYNKLESEGIPFTTHRLGHHKIELQEKIKRDNLLLPLSIETIPYTDLEEFYIFLQKHKKIFLKPNRGHKGLGISLFEISGEEIIHQNHNGEKMILTNKQLSAFFSSIPNIHHYHLQPQILSITKDGEPYVIRSYVGRNGKGKWITFFHYAAISLSGNSVVNVSRGSSISYIAPFLKDTFGEQDQQILKKLNHLSIQIAQRVQTFVKPMIDALGIDFGITKDGDIYIFEVNAFPGTRPFEALVEKYAVPFAIYLANNKLNNSKKA